MSWQLLILMQVFVVSVSMLSLRAIAKQRIAANAAYAVNAVVFIFLYLVGLSLLPLLGHIKSSAFVQYWPWYFGGGICFALTNGFYYKVVSHLDAGIAAILGTFGGIFTIVLAGLVLHEDLSPPQALGGFLILAAICYVLTIARQPGKHRKHNQSWLIGLGYSLISSVFFALALVNEKFLLSKSSASTYVVFGWGAQCLAAIGLAVILQRSQFKPVFKPAIFKLAVIGGVTRGLSGVLFILALVKSNNVALMTAVSNTKLIVIVLLAAIFLNEKQKITEKLTAAFLALAGLSIILWK